MDKKQWQVSIKGLVFDNERRLLLLQEEDGRWELPGGRMEHGETFAEALKRELKEETGVDSEVLDSHPYWAWTIKMENGRWVVRLGYRVKLLSLNFITTDECIDQNFFSVVDLESARDRLLDKNIIGLLQKYVLDKTLL